MTHDSQLTTHDSTLIILATHNLHKCQELAALLGDGPWRLQTLEHFPDVTLPPETGATFEENATIKAQAVCAATGAWAIGDDSGLMVDALGGAPGVYSARYAGVPCHDARNNERLLLDLINVAPNERSARYVCVLALARPGAPICLVRGACEGVIASVPRGQGGFGYDPLFFLPEHHHTMAELSPEEKNRISHRARAAEKLQKILGDLLHHASEVR